ncbi:MAG: hypothetical protein WDM92_16445 [Caulobacteraceae bacterium]
MNAPVLTDRLKALETGFFAENHKLFIGGEWVDAETGGDHRRDQSRHRPRHRQGAGRRRRRRGQGPSRPARAAFEGPWSKLTALDRAKFLWKLADLLEENADEIGLVERPRQTACR